MRLEVIKEEPLAAGRPTPILFVHGMWHAAWCWAEHFLPDFARHGYSSYALSLRGHGGSEGRERLRWTSLADYVSDLEQVPRQMGRVPVLVRHSMGGMAVQKSLESQVAPAAVLLASAPPSGLVRATLRVASRHLLVFMRANLKMSPFPIVSTVELAREALFSRGMPEERVQRYLSRLEDESYRAYLDMIGLRLPRPRRLRTPLLVLGGADDRLISPSEVAATARAFGTSAEIFPNMAHDMMLEDGWPKVADRILVWLNEQGL